MNTKNEITLSSSARLFKVDISTATGNKKDREATDKVNYDAGSASNAGTVRKKIFAHSKTLPKIEKFRSSARNELTEKLLPWEKPYHLIPNQYIIEHMAMAKKKQAEFESLVEQFKAELPELLEKAEESLGTLYRASDYPSNNPEEIDYYVKRHFGFHYTYPQVAEGTGFIADVLSDAKDQLTEALNKEHEQRFEDMTAKAWAKMKKALDTISTQMTDKEDGKPKKLYDTLISNGLTVCEMMRDFNFANNPEMDRCSREFEKVLKPWYTKSTKPIVGGGEKEVVEVDIDSLRDKDHGSGYRKEMKDDVDKVRTQVDSIVDKFGF